MSEDQSSKPTAEIASHAAKGLELREKFKRRGTQIGVARARDLKKQTCSQS